MALSSNPPCHSTVTDPFGSDEFAAKEVVPSFCSSLFNTRREREIIVYVNEEMGREEMSAR
jgi:hypothetical protein